MPIFLGKLENSKFVTSFILYNISELLFSCHLLGLCKSDDIDLVQVNFKGVNFKGRNFYNIRETKMCAENVSKCRTQNGDMTK